VNRQDIMFGNCFNLTKCLTPRVNILSLANLVFENNNLLIYIMTKMVKSKILFLLHMFSYLSQGSSRGTWEQMGGTIDVASHLNDMKKVEATTTATSSRLSTTRWKVDLSEDGRRMAVGGSVGLIEVYHLDVKSTSSSSQATELDVATWRLEAALLDVQTTGSFSLAPDGRMLAVRTSPAAVRVYQIVPENVVPSDVTPFTTGLSSTLKQIGNEVRCLDDGESVKLTAASSGGYYLAMGCESYLDDRGKVQIFELTTSFVGGTASTTPSYYWKAFLSALKGRNSGDRFGTAFSIIPAPSSLSNRAFRIAVGSPGFNQGQGMVQVFAASNDQTGWMQVGEDLTGGGIGEHFGTSLDLSSNEQPYMVVGAPDWALNQTNNLIITKALIGRGLIRLFQWQSPTFGSSARWTLVGDSLVAGTEDRDRFGSIVAISRTGERVVTSSSLSPTSSSKIGNDDDDMQNSNQRGYVGVYERESYNKLGSLVNDFLLGQQPMDGWGQSVAINEFASMVVSVSSEGMVRSFMDDSAFCGIPRSGGKGVTSDIEKKLKVDTLLERNTCRNFDILITDEVACVRQKVFTAGTYRPCVWQNVDLVTTMTPTTAPTLAPSEAPLPTISPPTRIPPTMKPTTMKPRQTMKPSFQKENRPTQRPGHQIPSMSPSEVTFSSSSPPYKPTAPRLTPAPTAFIGTPTSSKPTSRSINENESEVKACRCGSSDLCTEDPLSKNDLILRVCIFVSSSRSVPLSSVTATMTEVVTLDKFTLDQEGVGLALISSGRPVSLETSVRCNNSRGMTSLLPSPSCTVETTAATGSILFVTGRPYVDVVGRVRIGKGSSADRKLRRTARRTAQEQDGIQFSIRIPLQVTDGEIQSNDEPENHPGPGSGNESENESQIDPYFWIILAVAIMLLIQCCFKCKREHLSTAKPPSRPKSVSVTSDANSEGDD
jgi:hypothetical protein